ncbi:MAG: hypothetical protein COB54_04570 [Alphaproteobacteria bacterium]|nr:MAG: hypothetical protein COB54_04570 [Alphaproteobacteria bacterium]
MFRNTITTLIYAGLVTSFTAGCSGGEDYVFEHGPAGPNTKKTLKTLPEGLRPDNSKASYTGETLEPDQ